VPSSLVISPRRPTPAPPAEGRADAAFRPGCAADFERLYRQSHPKILATLVGILGDRALAEDCAQETFVRALRAWPRWRPDAPAEAWLHRIAVNVAINARRGAVLHRLDGIGERARGLHAAPDPAGQGGSELLAALRRLPAKQAAAVVLRHFHGYSNREIAHAIGVPERTVASRLSAAKERLRADLGWPAPDAVEGSDTEMGTSARRRVLSATHRHRETAGGRRIRQLAGG